MKKAAPQPSEFDKPKLLASGRGSSAYLDDSAEFIVKKETSKDGNDDELTPNTSLHRVGSTLSATHDSKGSTTASAAVPLASHPEWTILRLFSTVGGGFDLEMWWRRASDKIRLVVLIIILLLVVAILNMAIGIVFIVRSFNDKVEDPYICKSPECKKAAVRLQEFMNKSEDPCNNFYEFMCRDYVETDKEGDIFAELITVPSLKVEFGDDSMLAKLLKQVETDDKHNQHVIFYQSCLKFESQPEYRSDAFEETAELWFGTRDFNTFEKSREPSVAQIGANILKDFGHASFINMGFFTYPYIAILEPHPRIEHYRQPQFMPFLRTLFRGIMGYLHLDSEAVIDDMALGTHVMSTVIHELYSVAKVLKKSEEDAALPGSPPRKIAELIGPGGTLDGLCPPMGIQLDYFEVLTLFLNETYGRKYFTPTSRKYVMAFTACFGKNPGGFDFAKNRITNRKTAFVALWIADVFLHDLILGINQQDLISWGLGSAVNDIVSTQDDHLVNYIDMLTPINEQFNCLVSLWRVMGSIPSIRFMDNHFQSQQVDPAYWVLQAGAVVYQKYASAKDAFTKIPPTEIDWREAYFAELFMSRRLRVDIELPMLGGVFDTQVEDMEFSRDDLLRNIIVGSRYTVAKAQRSWAGATDPTPEIKWFGHGGPRDIRDTLFLPHLLRIEAARFVQTELAIKYKQWAKFNGRTMENHIRYPMSLFQGTKVEFMALKVPHISIPMYHSVLTLINEATYKENYPSLEWKDLLGAPSPDQEQSHFNDRPCLVLEATLHTDSTSRPLYPMVPSNVSDFTWYHEELFLSVLTLKLALKDFKTDIAAYRAEPFTFDMHEKKQKLVTRKRLSGWLSKFEEDQLFFMGYARDICRESWKIQKTEENQQKRYHLETTFLSILMQMEEFSKIWKCPKNSMMNNWGEPRCFQWKPDYGAANL